MAYRSEWPAIFDAEARHLRNTLASVLIDIHHIGSTSVPGLPAKPIIDILAVVRSLGELDARSDAMMALGYEPMGEFGIAGRRFFAKGGAIHRTHHIHAYELGHVEIAAHLDFRDYLRAHPGQARRYADRKARLAEQHRHDIEAYIAGKGPLVKELLESARQWRGA
ncbi:GrpB family protein [Candidatus Entotheonella palauensis]|uniref:GrpB family protein n=1 Tax=Candidatus Entotheonella palauensis TaxID=93172 RepID=UPI00211785BC|nr:GrpB family protein [Candidatus Entotheonella palauensis]